MVIVKQTVDWNSRSQFSKFLDSDGIKGMLLSEYDLESGKHLRESVGKLYYLCIEFIYVIVMLAYT